jgi:phage terminase large subunit
LLSQKLQLSETQTLALKLLNDPQVVDLLFGGGAGGAKSVLVCLWMVMECRKYPGIKIGLGRKELVRLKQTTVSTLLNKAHKFLNVKSHEFTYSDQKGLITYENGSQIQLIDLKRQPSDPDFDTFGSLEFTHIVIEEVGEVIKQAVDVLSSRKNRWLNTEYGIVGKTVMTCNPTQNFIRQEYYEPYKKLGMGRYQTWEDGEVIIPGTGERVKALKAFIRSLVVDNPFADPNYIEELKKKPGPIRKRLFEGNWDYDDTDNLLFPSYLIDRALISEIPHVDDAERGIGVDVSDKGADKTVMSYVENNILMEQQEVAVDVSPEAKPIGEQIALAVIKFAQQRKVPSRKVALDVIGVGASSRDFLKGKGWHIIEFNAADAGDDGYKNLRAESMWSAREDMDSDNFKINSAITTLELLRQEMLAHEYEDEDDVIKIKPKKKIKEDLGRSPDYWDSANIAHWASRGKKGARYNSKRIVY